MAEYTRRWRLRNYYQLTEPELANLRQQQNGRCGICDVETERLVVDHEHHTGRVRGLLCDRCNTGLGMLESDRLTAALEWLVRAPDLRGQLALF